MRKIYDLDYFQNPNAPDDGETVKFKVSVGLIESK